MVFFTYGDISLDSKLFLSAHRKRLKCANVLQPYTWQTGFMHSVDGHPFFNLLNAVHADNVFGDALTLPKVFFRGM